MEGAKCLGIRPREVRADGRNRRPLAPYRHIWTPPGLQEVLRFQADEGHDCTRISGLEGKGIASGP